MYRRVNSGGFIGAMTLGIVIVMAIFTWVMWGMANQVYVLTDVMLELNDSFKSMVVDMREMNGNVGEMRKSIDRMDATMAGLSGDVGEMNTNLATMAEDARRMDAAMAAMTNSIHVMSANMVTMTRDVGRASYAFSNPMSYMFGGSPFPF